MNTFYGCNVPDRTRLSQESEPILSHDTEDLFEKVKNLNELLWEGRAPRPAVEDWIANFTGDCKSAEIEQKHALYLLTKFLYFGYDEVRELLRAMFQDLFRNPLSVAVRACLTDKDDFDAMHRGFIDQLSRTRFLGLGNPAQSGTHILYDFRHVNRLPLSVFASPHDLFSGGLNDATTTWAFPRVHRIIFIDDFCGTGDQAKGIGSKYVPLMRQVAQRRNVKLEIWYLTLFATTSALDNLRAQVNIFDKVQTVSELDATYRVFDVGSQFYGETDSCLSKEEGETIARHYGERVFPRHSLGYRNSQLLLGFHHNIPNNTLPIIWRQRTTPPWYAIFPRST